VQSRDHIINLNFFRSRLRATRQLKTNGIPEININGVSEVGDKLEVNIMDYNFQVKVKLTFEDSVYEYYSDDSLEESYCSTICDFENGVFSLTVGNNKTDSLCQIWAVPDTVELLEKEDFYSKYKLKLKLSNSNGIKSKEALKERVFDCLLTRYL